MPQMDAQTYYKLKIAMQKAKKSQAKWRFRLPKLKLPTTPFLIKVGGVFGFSIFLALAFSQPGVSLPSVLLGTAWGCCVGSVAETLRKRSIKFVLALNGMRLEVDDVQELRRKAK
jgi:hypothetical protein